MSDLFDELAEKTNTNVATTVSTLGGDLFDELALKNGDTSKLSPALADQAVNDSRLKLTQSLNDDLGVIGALRVGIGRGIMTIGRAAGLAAPESPVVTRAFDELTSRAPIPTTIPVPGGGVFTPSINPQSVAAQGGEIVGEALPFLPLGVGAAAIKTIGPRILANAGIGALEGGSIIRGSGGNAGQQTTGALVGGTLAGTFEALIPVIGRMAGGLYRRLGRKPTGSLLDADGVPTPEFQTILDETGTKFDDLVADAFTEVNKTGVSPEQAARAARFESQGIPATQGDISQGFAQQAKEQRLVTMASGAENEPLRQLRLQQSEIFQTRVNELVDSLGVPNETGTSLKSALGGRQRLLKTEKTSLYKQVADADPEIKNIPLFVDDIGDAIPDSELLADLAVTAGDSINELNTTLVRFGVITDEAAVKRFTAPGMHGPGGTVTPLTVGNFDRFRKILNRIGRKDTTRAAEVAITPIREALDTEVNLIGKRLTNAGKGSDEIFTALDEARKRVRTLKTEFSPQAITGRLTARKTDNFTPLVEASKAANELLKPTAPIENLQRVLQSLIKSGEPGQRAIKNMRATVVLNALENSLKAVSRKTSGVQTIGGNQFAQSLNKFGSDKLAILFAGDKAALRKLQNLKQTALDVEATNLAVPKGSAAVNLDIARSFLNTAGLFSGITAIGTLLKVAFKPGIDARQLRKTLASKPELLPAANVFAQEFPALASALGIAAVVAPAKDNEK